MRRNGWIPYGQASTASHLASSERTPKPGHASTGEDAGERRRQRRAPFWPQRRRELEIAAIYVAPGPGLAAPHRRNEGMAGRLEVLQRVRVYRIFAASHMAA